MTPERPHERALKRMYPEVGAGGFSHADGTVQFFTRVQALLSPGMTVVDYGAGRGEWMRDAVAYRRDVRLLRGRVAEVIGVDVDPVVRENPTVDRAIVSTATGIPLQSASVDVVVSDHTFEHIEFPHDIAAELLRILRPGGWLCARTPNKLGYIALAARAVPNRWHVRVLERVQPHREAADVFPTRYLMNTRRDLGCLFPAAQWVDHTYAWGGEPGYFGSSMFVARTIAATSTLAPPALKPKLFIFLQKRP